MEEKVYFNFFILCLIVSQGILAKSLKEDVEETSTALVRQKRVIDRRPGADRPLATGDLPYVASLKYVNRLHCVATILSRHTAITAARCVAFGDLRTYSLYSGSGYSNSGNVHIVIDKKVHGDNPSRTSIFPTGISLLTVHPPFVYSHNTGSINLHSEPVLAGMQCIIAGWGFRSGSGPVETAYPKKLRSIAVPIINHRECLNIYRGHFPIIDEDICTYDQQKLCGDTDAGAPLVIANQLAGIYMGGVLRVGEEVRIKPDVFVLLQHSNYGQWIMRNIIH